jgi:hypothetical protein
MGSKGRGRVSNGTSQIARRYSEQLQRAQKTLGGGGHRVARGCTMAVAGGGGLCSNVGARIGSRARSEKAS